jgi:hypothetical protein
MPAPIHHLTSPLTGTFWAVLLAGGLTLLIPNLQVMASEPATPLETSTSSEASPTHLRFEIAPAVDDASLLPAWIATRYPDLASRLPEVHDHPQWISIQVAGSTYNYRIFVTAMRDGKPVGTPAPLTKCECSTEELLALIDTGIASALERFHLNPVEEPILDTLPPPEPPHRDVPPIAEPERRHFSRLGIGGIVLASLGATAFGIGISMLVDGFVPFPNNESRRRDWYRASGPMLVAGGFTIATGVTMTIADMLQCREHTVPRRCERHRGTKSRRATLKLGPALEANGGGVTLFGRF